MLQTEQIMWILDGEYFLCPPPDTEDIVHEKFQYIPANDTERRDCVMKQVLFWATSAGAAIFIIVLFVLLIWWLRRRSGRTKSVL